MILAEVVGRLWNDRELDDLSAHRFVIVRALDGSLIVAVDLIEVAAGSVVLVTTDESAQAAVGSRTSIDAAVVALVGGADTLDELLAAAEAAS